MFRFFAHGGKADLKAETDRECPPFAAATVKAAIDILPDGEVFNMTISGSPYDEVPEGTAGELSLHVIITGVLPE